MADISPDDIINFFKTLDPTQAKKYFDQLIASSSVAKDALTGVVQKFGSVDQITNKLKTSTQDLLEKFNAISDFDFQNFILGLRNGNQELATMVAQTAMIAETVATGIRPDAFNALGEATSIMNNDMGKTLDTLNKVSKIIPSFGLASKAVEGLRVFTDLAEPAKKLELGLLASASASGELGDYLEELGDNLDGLERKSITYTELIYQVSNATGYGTEQISKYAAELNKIPGALSTIIDTHRDNLEQMHLLQAAMLVASGTGQNFSQVIDEMTRVYREFGTTGQDALDVVSRIATVSQNLKMPIDLVKDYLSSASQSFRMFGDNSQAVLNIMGKFGPAFKEAGLGPRAISDLTQGLTRNVAEMSLAQRAFLSSTSGGPGGLQGAYQIELLKRQGKTDQVEEMVEQSLRRQFGGKILTLEEASKDAASAAQFTKQVQLITQGPTKLANNESEAYRILEAMAKGERGQKLISQVPSKEESFDQAIDLGNKIQERNYNQLVTITNKLDLSAQYASITANALTRNVLGPGIGQNAIIQRNIESTEKAATQQMIIGNEPLAGGTPEMDLNEILKMRINNLGTAAFEGEIKNLFQQMKAGATNMYQVQKEKLQGGVMDQVLNTTQAPQASTSALINQAASQNAAAPIVKSQTAPQIQTIRLENFCQQCQKKVAEDVAVQIVDGKIEKVIKGQTMHMHTGVNLGN